ncbi:hypothetical protein [Paenibacillus sp. FSL H8-0259]|uniref:hypothetical protein n=1 Tax=Paenibacillus sp. FSL H8-0259 TaxID=1920423 RepID=UPI00117C6A7C|nr:hypothetical protein [Paenibacillus sp. FSL H8-0259]
MKKIKLLLVFFLIFTAVSVISVTNASSSTNGFLNEKTMNQGIDGSSVSNTTSLATDNDESTFVTLDTSSPYAPNKDSLWYQFSSPITVNSYRLLADYANIKIDYYDSTDTYIGSTEASLNTGTKQNVYVKNVSKVVVSNTTSWQTVKIYEFNLFPDTDTGETLLTPINIPIYNSDGSISAKSWQSRIADGSDGTGNTLSNNAYFILHLDNETTITRIYTKGQLYVERIRYDFYSDIDQKNLIQSYTPTGTGTAENKTGLSIPGVRSMKVTGLGDGHNYMTINVYGEPTIPSATPTSTPIVTPSPSPSPSPTPSPSPEQPSRGRAILVLTMNTGLEKEFDLTSEEITAFLNWYDSANGSVRYGIDKHDNNKGPFSKRTEYVIHDKILTFEVNEYTTE